jgi:dTDP-glucose 4,6-dehydratase
MARVVVAGGAGFIGSHLCEALVRQGHDVVAVDNFSTGRPENVERLQEAPGFTLVGQDLVDGLDVAGAVHGVFHLASPASPVDYLRLPLETLDVGSRGTWNAVHLALRKKARFVLASTSETYGDPLVHPQGEDYWGNVNPVGVRSVYDEAKRFAEALTMAAVRHRGLDGGVVRIFNTYGPRLRPDDGRAVPTFIVQALANQPITVSGSGTQTRSFCYVSDLVSGLIAMYESRIPGPVNLGYPNEITIGGLAMLIKQLTGSSSAVQPIAKLEDDPGRRRPDVRRARDQLGWVPQVSLDQGLRRTIEWFSRLEPADSVVALRKMPSATEAAGPACS